jgi:hypothetical protein
MLKMEKMNVMLEISKVNHIICCLLKIFLESNAVALGATKVPISIENMIYKGLPKEAWVL